MQTHRKKFCLGILLVVGVLFVVSPVFADRDDWRYQSGERPPVARVSERDLRSFDAYLDSHWETAQELYRNPDLLNDRSYVRKHDALRDWLEDHPDAAPEIRANPRTFLWREREYGRREERSPIDRVSERDLRSFDHYLDSHWETAQELYRDPDLINDRRFLRDHDALRDWLDDHPDAARVIAANPRDFLWRQRASSRRSPQSLDPEDVRSFEQYLDSHWDVADALYRDPELINDTRFVHSHRSLDDWLHDHSDAARVISERPRDFLWRQRNLNVQDFLQQLLR